METDPEAKGTGNSYTTEFRQYDPRLGRWLSLDPLMMKFPWMSPYVAFDNNPIYFTDPYGLESGTKEDNGDENRTRQDAPSPQVGGEDRYYNTQTGKLNENFQEDPAQMTNSSAVLSHYTFDSDANKWNTKNDWRIRQDEDFRVKLNVISKNGLSIANNLKKEYPQLANSKSNTDIGYMMFDQDNILKEGMALKMDYTSKDGRRTGIVVVFSDIHYETDDFYGQSGWNHDFYNLGQIRAGITTNCFAYVLGIRGYIQNSSDLVNALSGDGYKVAQGKVKAGDIIILNDSHAMIVVGFKNGETIYKSKNIGPFTPMTGTFQEINAKQHGGDLVYKNVTILRK
jgi:RHS repeat-associated protein